MANGKWQASSTAGALATGDAAGQGDLLCYHRLSEGGNVWIGEPDAARSISIPSNIAEGATREGDKEYSHFLSIARGSISELDTQVQIAVMLSYIAEDHPLHGLLDRVGKLLSGFSKKLEMDVGKK